MLIFCLPQAAREVLTRKISTSLPLIFCARIFQIASRQQRRKAAPCSSRRAASPCRCFFRFRRDSSRFFDFPLIIDMTTHSSLFLPFSRLFHIPLFLHILQLVVTPAFLRRFMPQLLFAAAASSSDAAFISSPVSISLSSLKPLSYASCFACRQPMIAFHRYRSPDSHDTDCPPDIFTFGFRHTPRRPRFTPFLSLPRLPFSSPAAAV